MNLASLLQIPRTVRSIQRAREILRIIARYGFEPMLVQLGLGKLHQKWLVKAKVNRHTRRMVRELTAEERIRKIFEDLGPTFIKLAQILATRPDIVPTSLIEEFQKLQDDVPPFSWEQAQKLVTEELGCPIEKVFSEFASKPFAAASIAQVHKAYIKGENTPVVVKIQRPGLRETIEMDLDIMAAVADLIDEKIPESRSYNLPSMVKELRKSILKEVDFHKEAANLRMFAGNFSKDKQVKVPKLYPQGSSSKILTMEFINGIKASNVEDLKAAGLDPEKLASTGTRVCLDQIFRHGLFHGDPHPGNVFFMPQDGAICFIDYGMVGIVTEERQEELLTFLLAIFTNDVQRLVTLFLRLDLMPVDTNLQMLKMDLRHTISNYLNLPLDQLDFTIMMTDIFEVIREHRIKIPTDLILLSKALATVVGMAQALNPHYNPLDEMKSYLLAHYAKQIANPKNLLKKIYYSVDDLLHLLHKLPKEIETILAQIHDGKITLQIHHTYPPEYYKNKNQQTQIFVQTAITIALLLGICWIIAANPQAAILWQFPIFVATTISMVALFFSLWRFLK